MGLIRFLPPIILDFYLKKIKPTGWFGDYASWDQAQKNASGYDSPKITERIISAAKLVISNKAAYEKDGVVFSEPAYNWPVLTHLMLAATQNNGNLSVLDFGGSLGSLYFQHKKYLDQIQTQWSVVEQEHFVKIGQAQFEQNGLHFFQSVNECKSAENPTVLLLACVLQYLEDPYATLAELVQSEFQFIILDRIAFTNNDLDRITLQKVPAKIYPASYPAWFFSKSKIQSIFDAQYELVCEYPCDDKPNIPGYFSGLVYKRK